VLFAHPHSQNLRGSGASSIIICEEIAFMDPVIITDVVLPTLVKADVAMICITTLQDTHNFWTRIIETKDEFGKPIIKSLRYSLICDECIAQGKAESCRHKMGDLPYWQSQEKHEKIKQLMQENNEAFLRETKGLLIDPLIKPVFDSASIDYLVERPFLNTNQQAFDYIYVTVDPAAGGCSRYAILSAVYTMDDIMIKPYIETPWPFKSACFIIRSIKTEEDMDPERRASVLPLQLLTNRLMAFFLIVLNGLAKASPPFDAAFFKRLLMMKASMAVLRAMHRTSSLVGLDSRKETSFFKASLAHLLPDFDFHDFTHFKTNGFMMTERRASHEQLAMN